MEKETETVQNPLTVHQSPPTEPQNRLTGPQNLQQATEPQSQATMHLLPTTGLQSLPTVSLGLDSLHLVLGKFESDVVDISIILKFTILRYGPPSGNTEQDFSLAPPLNSYSPPQSLAQQAGPGPEVTD